MRPRLLPLFPALLSLILAACALPYYSQAVRGQVGVLRQRVPIAEVVVDPDVPAETRDRLRLATEIRQFAVGKIGLPGNESYTSFVALERDFVVWNVVAAGEFSVEPETWCFPIAGCVAYRGYFDRGKAEAFAAKLESQGLDTFIGGAVAYSTLGFFADPILDTMLGRDETEIAAILFHELAHQRLYVKDDTELNESFATAVEQYAVEAWLESRDESAELAAYRDHLDRQAAFAGLVAEQRRRMADIFATGSADAELRLAKAGAYAEMRRDYEALRASWGNSAEFDGWFAGEFNNARLVALTSYRRWVPGLRRRLEILGPGAFYLEAGDLARLEPEQRALKLEAWNADSAVAALADRRELVNVAAQAVTNDGLHRPGNYLEGGEAVLTADARNRK
jgi:predicted aminopeptidase